MSTVFKKILCPVDFDDQSISALRYAGDLARDNDATLYVMHVLFGPLPRGEFRLEPSPEASQELAKLELQKIVRKHLGRELQFELVIRLGKPADAIIEAADDLGVDLIVMATHGKKGVTRLFLGSVAERVIRTSKRPVLMIRPADGGS
jgi:universal stress protein A